VTAVCGSASFDLVKRLGADEAIDYRATDFTTLDTRWDVVYDAIGSKSPGACARVLGGRKVYVTTKPGVGTFVRQAVNPLFGVKVFGLITTGAGEDLERIKGFVERGQLAPVIDKVLPIEQVASAQEYSKTGRAKGKIVLSL
ncbi:MAG TPA: zinc-binding dehydrogenase, partial [Minicystis sp.]|nr:zinc-binding dehydrogenase [Minicystis sp.]